MELSMKRLKTIGGYRTLDPPLPIPNREVKHSCANGTEKNRESRLLPYKVFVQKSGSMTLNLSDAY